jgi:hypothetical protein
VERIFEMSGDGVISVRLPRSLLGLFRAAAVRQSHTIHSAARFLVDALTSLSPDELKALKEPPRESDTPRVSLYLGWDLIDVLAQATYETSLNNSSILRRLLFGLLIDRTIQFVQQKSGWELRLVQKNSQEISRLNEGGAEA